MSAARRAGGVGSWTEVERSEERSWTSTALIRPGVVAAVGSDSCAVSSALSALRGRLGRSRGGNESTNLEVLDARLEPLWVELERRVGRTVPSKEGRRNAGHWQAPLRARAEMGGVTEIGVATRRGQPTRPERVHFESAERRLQTLRLL